MSTAFHPQTDGQTERQNQELEAYLRMYVNYQQDNWVPLLPTAEYAYNSKAHASHRMSPIEVATGVKPKGFDAMEDDHWLRQPPADWSMDGKTPEIRRRVNDFLSERAQMFKNAQEALVHAQEAQRRWYNSKRSSRHYAIGDLVILKSTNIKTKRPCKKLDARYLGPFPITAKIGKLSYRIELPPAMARLHPVFHVSLLEKWNKPRDGQVFRPGPTELDDGNRYEVEAILAHKLIRSKLHFHVKWLGWPPEESTWEPESSLDDCQEILQEYWANPSNQTPSRARKEPGPTTETRRSLRGSRKG
jgi:hypothetical protein